MGIDPYLIALIATVTLASLLPVHGLGAEIMDKVVYAAVALLFFLYGAKLSPKAVAAGLLHWRLQSLVFLSTFVLFPLIGIGLTLLLQDELPQELVVGLMFLCVLPSTVQSSIAFTSIARGNVPAALCSASISNLVGMFLTPVLVGLLLTTSELSFSLDSIWNIVLQLFVPFLAGQAARPLIGRWLEKRKPVVSLVDRGSILLVVYAAFSEGMVAGIWSQLEWEDLAIVIGLDVLILGLVLALTTFVSRRGGFSKEDEIAIVFCGSKKSLAAGIPMANILFPAGVIGMVVLPLMLFHQLQLFACATLAQRYARRTDDPAPRPAGETSAVPSAP
ncbi:bile acid:sodium symporter family protein [Geminicoccus roseus]|uniref:bile acid:sodium symporter family protein n=1 Tax=Geminicoccus roseus TaxID=404900 RepID=UPI0006887789|nr:bile acid:sodium symporter family protein [Geminicoccus roseus]